MRTPRCVNSYEWYSENQFDQAIALNCDYYTNFCCWAKKIHESIEIQVVYIASTRGHIVLKHELHQGPSRDVVNCPLASTINMF